MYATQAEAEFINAKKPKEAIDMYVHQQVSIYVCIYVRTCIYHMYMKYSRTVYVCMYMRMFIRMYVCKGVQYITRIRMTAGLQ